MTMPTLSNVRPMRPVTASAIAAIAMNPIAMNAMPIPSPTHAAHGMVGDDPTMTEAKRLLLSTMKNLLQVIRDWSRRIDEQARSKRSPAPTWRKQRLTMHHDIDPLVSMKVQAIEMNPIYPVPLHPVRVSKTR